MLHIFDPRIEAPVSNSPDWYKDYHNSFYLCQLVSSVLSSYVDTFIELYERGRLISEKKEELIEKGILSAVKIGSSGESVETLDPEKLYALAVEEFLEDIVTQFKSQTSQINSTLAMVGVSAGDYFEKEISIDLDALLSSSHKDDWYQVVNGFLNVWQFMFMFCLLESSLKNYIDTKSHTTELIEKLFKQHPELIVALEENHSVSSDFVKDTWLLYTFLRNLYSHTHGVIYSSDESKFRLKINSFRSSYRDLSEKFPEDYFSFKSIGLVNDADDFFKEEAIQQGKFYLIENDELNIFRNLTSNLMYELSKVNS